jgi:hypothetical protein
MPLTVWIIPVVSPTQRIAATSQRPVRQESQGRAGAAQSAGPTVTALASSRIMAISSAARGRRWRNTTLRCSWALLPARSGRFRPDAGSACRVARAASVRCRVAALSRERQLVGDHTRTQVVHDALGVGHHHSADAQLSRRRWCAVSGRAIRRADPLGPRGRLARGIGGGDRGRRPGERTRPA